MSPSLMERAREAARDYLVRNANQKTILLYRVSVHVDQKLGREFADSLFGYEQLLPEHAYCEWLPSGLYVVHNPFSKEFCPKDEWLYFSLCLPSYVDEHVVQQMTETAMNLAHQHKLWFMSWRLPGLDHVFCYRVPEKLEKVIDELALALRAVHPSVYFESTNGREWNLIAQSRATISYHIP